MADVSASMVMELRGRTGLGMMECKKALTETGGDMAKAEDLLRIKSGAKASRAADRVASEGVIGLYVTHDAKTAAMVEVNCETDFVSKNDEFRAFARDVAHAIAKHNVADLAALGTTKLDSGATVEERRVALLQKIGENVSIRRFVRKEAVGKIASYVHGVKIGAIVDVSGGEHALARGLAMHIAASKPMVVSADQLPIEVVEKERAIAAARAAESGKPPNIVEKMVDGAVAKFLAEVTLLGQPYVVNEGKQTVAQALKAELASVNSFTLYVVGEGIAKKKDDFAAEVAAMAKA